MSRYVAINPHTGISTASTNQSGMRLNKEKERLASTAAKNWPGRTHSSDVPSAPTSADVRTSSYESNGSCTYKNSRQVIHNIKHAALVPRIRKIANTRG